MLRIKLAKLVILEYVDLGSWPIVQNGFAPTDIDTIAIHNGQTLQVCRATLFQRVFDIEQIFAVQVGILRFGRTVTSSDDSVRS